MTLETVANSAPKTSPEVLRMMLDEGIIDQDDFIAMGGNDVPTDTAITAILPKLDDEMPEAILHDTMLAIDNEDTIAEVYGSGDEQPVEQEADTPDILAELSDDNDYTKLRDVTVTVTITKPGPGYAAGSPVLFAPTPTESAPTSIKSIKVRAPKAPKAIPTPRQGAFSTQGDYVASFAGNEIELFEGTRFPAVSLVNNVNAKKIREKVVNLCEHIYRGRPLSVYTSIAVRELKDKGALTAKNLAYALMNAVKKRDSAGYSAGTAASQAQQQMTLLRTFGVIDPNGKLNTHSLIWAKLSA